MRIQHYFVNRWPVTRWGKLVVILRIDRHWIEDCLEWSHETTEQAIINKDLLYKINTLKDKQRKVLLMYYVDEMTMKQIGNVLGVTEARVSQIHKKAKEVMRCHFMT